LGATGNADGIGSGSGKLGKLGKLLLAAAVIGCEIAPWHPSVPPMIKARIMSSSPF